MKVFVTGGTGAIGRHAVRALLREGHEVSALARSDRKAADLQGMGARPVRASLFDPSELSTHFVGQDAVINLATALPATNEFMRKAPWLESDRVRIEGSSAVVDAALDAGVPRLIQESVVMLYEDRGDEWIDEDVPTDTYPMTHANHVAETNAARFSLGAGDSVTLRLGWFYGPGATHSEEFFRLAQRHLCIQMGRPHTYLSSIHMEDAGTAVVAALTATAGVYNIVDDEPLTKRAYANALAQAAGTRAWLRLPGRAALLLGNRSTSLTRSLRVSNDRFRTATGWRPRYPSAREGWMATAPLIKVDR